MKLNEDVQRKVNQWLEGKYDEETKETIRNMQSSDPDALTDAFYRSLEFGTGGMRGKMGPGTNRMNIYTVGMATQGLANYMLKMFTGNNVLKVAVSHDNRNNSRKFAETVADVLSGNGITVYLFESLRPTPELSFTIRYLGCQSGVMVTASHNPKEYNGYKVYWEDGAQLIPPHDRNVIQEVEKILDINEVKFTRRKELVKMIGNEIDNEFLKMVKSASFSEKGKFDKEIKIVYTPLHGTGGRMVPKALEIFGFKNVIPVEEQMVEDGNFPTAKSPNPEEAVALEMAIKRAKETNADLVMANDPDADRVGIAVKDHNNRFILLNGNQTGAILMDFVLGKIHSENKLRPNDFVVTTIVTSDIIKEIADSYSVKYYDVLTGFKWIGGIIRELEGKEKFLIGLEESYGYMIGDFVRDKDAVTASAVIAEMAAESAAEGKTLFDRLLDVYIKYGFYKENLISINKEGKSGAEEIKKMMENFRLHPLLEIAGSKVVRIADYQLLKEINLLSGEEKTLNLPKSNVLQFFTEDGSKISARPSGTEPKIKFYFSVKEKLQRKEDYDNVSEKLNSKIRNIIKSLNLN